MRPENTSSGGNATLFAVTSGKGGVGKTSMSVNLAVEFSKRGYRTIVVDVDLGLANTHILAGVRLEHTLSEYLDGRAQLVDCITPGPAKVKFISGGSGVKEMANLDEAGRQKILTAVQDLRPFCDVIILDTSAGISKAVTDFVSISDHTVVVTTPDFTAVADAYGMIKTLNQEQYSKTMHLLVNRARSREEAEQVYKKLKDCTARFLNFDLNWLGLVPDDNVVESAMVERTPFTEAYGDSVVTRYLRKVVQSLERLVSQAPSTRT